MLVYEFVRACVFMTFLYYAQDFPNMGLTMAALEALGAAAEEHLHLLLPSLARLIQNGQIRDPFGKEDPRRLAIRWVPFCVGTVAAIWACMTGTSASDDSGVVACMRWMAVHMWLRGCR